MGEVVPGLPVKHTHRMLSPSKYKCLWFALFAGVQHNLRMSPLLPLHMYQQWHRVVRTVSQLRTVYETFSKCETYLDMMDVIRRTLRVLAIFNLFCCALLLPARVFCPTAEEVAVSHFYFKQRSNFACMIIY